MKQDIKIKLTKSDIEDYDKSVYMAEYVPVNKEHYRRIRTCVVVSLGINLFLLLVMVLR